MNTIRTVVLLTVLTLGLVFIGGMIGGQQGALIALILAGVMNMGSYWFSDKIVIKMYRGSEVTSGQLFDVVAEICQTNQLPMPKVYTLPQATPNAFATGRNPNHAVVAATEGIMQILTRDELKGVMAHEMSHVMHRDILIGSVAAAIDAGEVSPPSSASTGSRSAGTCSTSPESSSLVMSSPVWTTRPCSNATPNCSR